MYDISGFLREQMMEVAIDLVRNYWQYIAIALGGIAAIGMALGSIKRLTGLLFASMFRLGAKAAGHVMARPKVAGGIVAVIALVGTGMWLGYQWAPVRIVELKVPVTADETELLSHLRGEVAAAQSRQAQAESREEAARSQASDAQATIDRIVSQKAQADREIAALSQQLANMSPDRDRSKMEQLTKSLDDIHISGIFDEIEHLKKTSTGWQGRYVDVNHPGRTITYHRGCQVCSRNLTINKEMDAIINRHSRWTRTSWPDEKALLAEENANLTAEQRKKAKEEREKAEEERKAAERFSKMVTAFGETKSIAEWAKDDIRGEGLKPSEIAERIEAGWPAKKAIELSFREGIDEWNFRRAITEEKKKADLERRRKLADEEEKRAELARKEEEAKRLKEERRKLEDEGNAIVITINGTTKSALEWSKDRRCFMGLARVIERYKEGKGTSILWSH